MDWRHCLLKGHVRRIAITNVGRVKSFVPSKKLGYSHRVWHIVKIPFV
jgi:hypothetical protein